MEWDNANAEEGILEDEAIEDNSSDEVNDDNDIEIDVQNKINVDDVEEPLEE